MIEKYFDFKIFISILSASPSALHQPVLRCVFETQFCAVLLEFSGVWREKQGEAREFLLKVPCRRKNADLP